MAFNPYIDNTGGEILGDLSQVNEDIPKYEAILNDLNAKGNTEGATQIQGIIDELKVKKSQLEEAKEKFPATCTRSNQDIGWMRENIEPCKTYLNSEQYAYWQERVKSKLNGPDPCGTSVTAQINKALKYLFETLKGVKKYYNKFVKPTLNAISGLSETISNATSLISGALRILIQRVRNWLIQKIKNLLGDALNNLFPNLAKTVKDAVVKLTNDAIFCKFGEIIKGLGKMVSDFVMSLIGKLINAPFCAAQQFTNALINNLANRIDAALKPILDQVNSILGGVGKVAGSIFEAIDFILGFESFLCSEGPECPEIKNFQTAWWGGKQEEAADRFETFLGGLNLSSGESSDLLNQFDRWLGDQKIFKASGNKIDPDTEILGNTLDQECAAGAYRCGVPQIQIFGGGGAGAVGDAIVNNIGQVVGVNLRYGGSGYTSTPYVSVIDNCGNGNNASAYAVLEDDPDCDPNRDPVTLSPKNICTKKVKEIVIVNPGNGYLPAPDGRDEFGNIVEENPGRETADITREYVGCLDEIEVISTGIGYTEQDSISIEPNIPNLEVKVRLTEIGQIVQMDIVKSPCGLTQVPDITINSKTGGGAQFRPIIRFTPKPQFKGVVREEDVIKVVDCVLR